MANKFFRQVVVPSAATETTIYTVPAANTAILRSLRITNANASRTNITVSQYTNGTGTEHFLLKNYALAPDTTMDVFNGVPCVLEAGDVLKVESSQATNHFYLSYMEMDRN